MKWSVVVDISPKTIRGTNRCHKYLFDQYKTKKEATFMAAELERLNYGKATDEKVK